MTEYGELKKSIEAQGKKIDRLLSWAEGDSKLGTPSIAQQIKNCETEIVNTRKRTYENETNIDSLKRDVDDISDSTKKASTIVGAGAGGGISVILEAIKQIFSI